MKRLTNYRGSILVMSIFFMVVLYLTASAFLVASYVAITGSRVGGVFTKLWGRHTGWWLSGVVLAAWGYKVISYKEVIPW